MEDPQITRINGHLESLNYWTSIYETGATYELVELLDLIDDMQLDLQASAAVLPVLQQETQAQDVVAVEQSGAGPSCAIPSLSDKTDDFENQEVPRLQQLIQMLSTPFAPEQLNEVLPILKNIPPLIADFLNKRHAMIKQQRQYQRQQQQQPQQQQQQQDQPRMSGINRQFRDQPELSGDPEDPVLMQRGMESLIHACYCASLNCELASCRRMKYVMTHVYRCKKLPTGGCPVCKQLYDLSYHHTRVCQVKRNCKVPFCYFIKRKQKEDEMQELLPILRKPNTPEHQNQIFHIFKEKPHLMADVIVDRENFDLCLSWLIGFDLEGGSSPADANQVNPQDGQSSSLIQGCIQHKVQDCQKLNRLEAHVKNCKKRTDGYCLPCKRLRNFYGSHALLCQVQDNKCSTPFCVNVKRVLKELPECHKSLQARLLRRYRHWML